MSQTWDYDILCKIIVVGDSAVGKSCLLMRYADDTFTSNHMTTIGVDFKLVTHKRDGKTVKMQIWDTAGQERFRTITEAYYRGAHGIMLVYDITNRESFQNIRKWVEDINKYRDESAAAVILVGNKVDKKDQRAVTIEEAEALAKELGISTVVEASAKAGNGVQESFNLILEKVLQQRTYLEKKKEDNVIVPGLKQKTSPPADQKCGC